MILPLASMSMAGVNPSTLLTGEKSLQNLSFYFKREPPCRKIILLAFDFSEWISVLLPTLKKGNIGYAY
jgi:hypothetical protein